MPLVSVIMSVYNGERYLREAVESILTQVFTDFEFLIMDDGSSDKTSDLLAEYDQRDSRIKVFSQENRGLGDSLNTLIGLAQGQYLARMDADDISEPGRFAVQVDYMSKHPEHAFVVCGSLVINSGGQVISGKYLQDSDLSLREILLSGDKNPFTHGAIMFRKSCLLSLGMIYRFRYSQDFDLLLRLAHRYEIGANELVLYRFRQGSLLQNDYVKMKHRLEQRKMLLEVYHAGRIFDDEFCVRQVAKIYSDKNHVNKQKLKRLNFEVEQHRCELKVKFIDKQFNELRKLAIKFIQEYGINKIYLAYLIISFLPQSLTVAILDYLNCIRNRKSNPVIVNLTIKELLLFSKHPTQN